MATQWFIILSAHAEVLKALFTLLSGKEGRQLLRAPWFTRLQEEDWLFGGICSLSFLKRAVTYRINLLCLQDLHMRFRRGARSRGKPGKLQPHYLELCGRKRGKQMVLREQSLKAVCHAYQHERFRRQNTRLLIPSTTQRTKFSPPSVFLQRIQRLINSGTVHPVTQQWERWDNGGLRRKKSQPVRQMPPSRILFSWKEKGILLLSQVFSLNL